MIFLRSNFGWRAKGNVSISSISGMRARLRRSSRAFSSLTRYSASSTCRSNRSWEKRPRRALASNSSQSANSPPRRRYLSIFRSSSSIVVLAFWFIGRAILPWRLVINGQVRLVGQKALLVGRTLAEALVHLHVGQGFLSLAHAEPGDALECFHLHHAIAPGPGEGLGEYGRCYLAREREQLAQEAVPLDAGRLEGEVHIGGHRWVQGPQPLFLVLRAVVATLGQVSRRRLSLGAEMGVFDS